MELVNRFFHASKVTRVMYKVEVWRGVGEGLRIDVLPRGSNEPIATLYAPSYARAVTAGKKWVDKHR